jgi:hypothetical protein
VESLFGWVVEVVESDGVDNLQHTEFFHFIVGVETEGHACKTV